MKRILLFGGTGSLGTEFVKRYLAENKICVYSRDEHKQWRMKLDFPSDHLSFVIGDVADKGRVMEVARKFSPHVIIIASALKHIDQCEMNISQCIRTNLLGTKNILDVSEELPELETVLFVSTDKACNPVTSYGMCKALCENMMIEKSRSCPRVKYISVRCGNVLNTRGSIIPLLHRIGRDASKTHFTLTHPEATRFLMTLEQSVDLLGHALEHAETGDIVVPQIDSVLIADLVGIFSEIYNKRVEITSLRGTEKLHEILINESESCRLKIVHDYFHITSVQNEIPSEELSSSFCPLLKSQLKELLVKLSLL